MTCRNAREKFFQLLPGGCIVFLGEQGVVESEEKGLPLFIGTAFGEVQKPRRRWHGLGLPADTATEAGKEAVDIHVLPSPPAQ